MDEEEIQMVILGKISDVNCFLFFLQDKLIISTPCVSIKGGAILGGLISGLPGAIYGSAALNEGFLEGLMNRLSKSNNPEGLKRACKESIPISYSQIKKITRSAKFLSSAFRFNIETVENGEILFDHVEKTWTNLDPPQPTLEGWIDLGFGKRFNEWKSARFPNSSKKFKTLFLDKFEG